MLPIKSFGCPRWERLLETATRRALGVAAYKGAISSKLQQETTMHAMMKGAAMSAVIASAAAFTPPVALPAHAFWPMILLVLIPAASALAATSGPGFEPGRGQEFESVFDAARLPPPGECWARAEACYEEALRWDAEGCGEDARRGLRACAEAFR